MSRPRVSLRRSAAASLIEALTAALASPSMSDAAKISVSRGLLRSYGIEGTACHGSAHDNEAHVDHCLCCAPHWGVITTEVKVR